MDNQAQQKCLKFRDSFKVISLYFTHLVGQFLIKLLGNGIVELPLKIPWRNPDGVNHLHRHKHDGL